MAISPRIAAATAAVMIAAACSGSDDTGEQGSSDPNSGTATDSTSTEISDPTPRAVTRVVVTGANAETLEEIHTVLVDYGLLGEALEEIVILDSPACEGIDDDLLICQDEAESLTPPTGRQALVVLDGELGNAAEVAAMLHMRPAVFVAGEPTGGEDAAALAGVSATITFVPGGLSELVSDTVTAFLIGVRDELGAFTPLESADTGAMSSAHHFLDTRLETMIDNEPNDEPDDAVVPEPDVRWVIELPDPTTDTALHQQAVVVDDIVAFLGNDGIARGLDTDTGDVLWTRQINDSPSVLNASFVDAAGSTLLVSVGSTRDSPDLATPNAARSLWALDIRSGAVLWELPVPAGGTVGNPATDGERVFVWIAPDTSDVSFRALDMSDGTEIWRVEGATMGAGPPRVADGEVWTGNRDGVLLGLNAATGNELVRFEEVGLGTFGIAARPAVTDDKVFFGNDSGTFSAIDRTTGKKIWTFAAESINLPSSPVITDNTVIFGSFDGGIYGLDTATGELRWRHDAGEGALFLSSAAVAGNIAYIAEFSQPSSILAIDVTTGQQIWELPIGDSVAASPYIDGDTLYIQTPGQFWAIAL